MDKKQMNMRKPIIFLLTVLLPVMAFSQVDYTWEVVRMDSTYDNGKDLSVVKIIDKYKSLVEPLQEIIGYSEDEYSDFRPESPLSNFAADALRDCAAKLSGRKVDVALMNFGGIRTSLPKGAVRVYDIYSIFPFNNDIVCFDIKGSNLRRILENMVASGKIQVWSNVRMVVEGKKITSLEVDGAPLDDNRTYRMSSINFLMNGGDGLYLSKVADNVWSSKIFIRDAFVDYIKEKTAAGEKLKMSSDGRVKIIDK